MTKQTILDCRENLIKQNGNFENMAEEQILKFRDIKKICNSAILKKFKMPRRELIKKIITEKNKTKEEIDKIKSYIDGLPDFKYSFDFECKGNEILHLCKNTQYKNSKLRTCDFKLQISELSNFKRIVDEDRYYGMNIYYEKYPKEKLASMTFGKDYKHPHIFYVDGGIHKHSDEYQKKIDDYKEREITLKVYKHKENYQNKDGRELVFEKIFKVAAPRSICIKIHLDPDKYNFKDGYFEFNDCHCYTLHDATNKLLYKLYSSDKFKDMGLKVILELFKYELVDENNNENNIEEFAKKNKCELNKDFQLNLFDGTYDFEFFTNN